MQIHFAHQAVSLPQPIKAHARRRALLCLSRFAPRLQQVAIQFLGGDELQPDDAAERCRIEALVKGVGIVAVEERDQDLYRAVDLATARLARAVRRALAAR